VLNLTRDLFKQLLTLAVRNTVFIFDGKLYEQTEGLGMGLPLGPTFANIFMSFHEEIWLRDCPEAFKPTFYRRYIDDTFLLFQSKSHVSKFLDYCNSKHPNIKFTYECEANDKLNFLDITVSRRDDSFFCSVYRKPTFSGLGTSYFSFCSLRFKLTALQTLIHRAYNICTTYKSMHMEFNFLRDFFKNNGYPSFLIEKYIKRFLNSKFQKRYPVVDVPRKIVYASLPYFGHQSDKMRTELTKLLSIAIPFADIRLILVNPLRISSFFGHKDRLPTGISASVVYEFCCARGSAPVSYIGSTKRHLFQRIAEHAGVSFRSGRPLSHPPHSSIREHSEKCSCNISIDSFTILGSAKNELDLRILESLFIHRKRPQLNEMLSSHPLRIL
jgi:hypothetical protein